jgi:hypothetical protein
LWNYSHLNTSTQIWSPKFQAKNAGGTASERLSGQNYLNDCDEFLEWFKSCLPRFSQGNRSLSELEAEKIKNEVSQRQSAIAGAVAGVVSR